MKKKLSGLDIDLKRSYKLIRQLKNISGAANITPVLKNETRNGKIRSNGRLIPVKFFYDKKLSDYNDSGVIIFFHGGGWTVGSTLSYSAMCVNLMKYTDYFVVSVDYRLAPEHKFPYALYDCRDAVKYIYEFSKRFSGVDAKPKNLITMGDSAGGNLSAALNLMLRDEGCDFYPSKQILLYPSVYNNHGQTSPFKSMRDYALGQVLTASQINDYIDLYKNNDDDLKNPYFAPLMATDFSTQPDTLIITAELDPLRDEGEEYGIKLAEAGNNVIIHRVKNVGHGFFDAPPHNFPEVAECYELILKFLNAK